ncbi:MAG TPA: hypothetical protein VFM55_17235 [Micromonosporaceae bacterium]|nr:hypothetical protein [Micromonosporaceae bacterium]
MRPMWWVVGVVVAVALLATYCTWTAARVDRLHVRAARAGRVLDAHLLRRAAAAAVLAEESGRTELYAAARAALDAGPDEREAAENDLTKRLRQLALPAAGAAAENVVAASRRVGLARQVHNDLVRDALGVRRRRLVRLLGLARRHPSPAYFDVDDPTLEEA